MDRPNLNMSQYRWLDVVKDYDCKILYHLVKANVVVVALSRKVATIPIRDLFLRMMVITQLLEWIRIAQVEAMKEEHCKSDHIMGQVSSFYYDSKGLSTLNRRVWVPYWGGV